MKYLYALALLFLGTKLYAEDPQCLDIRVIARGGQYQIVQRISAHTYELHLGNAHMILRTKRAIFSAAGKPWGIKVKNTYEIKYLPMDNGFTQPFGELVECGIVPMQYGPLTPMLLARQGYVVRQRLKEDQPGD